MDDDTRNRIAFRKTPPTIRYEALEPLSAVSALISLLVDSETISGSDIFLCTATILDLDLDRFAQGKGPAIFSCNQLLLVQHLLSLSTDKIGRRDSAVVRDKIRQAIEDVQATMEKSIGRFRFELELTSVSMSNHSIRHI